jgi:hypothetical protein
MTRPTPTQPPPVQQIPPSRQLAVPHAVHGRRRGRAAARPHRVPNYLGLDHDLAALSQPSDAPS